MANTGEEESGKRVVVFCGGSGMHGVFRSAASWWQRPSSETVHSGSFSSPSHDPLLTIVTAMCDDGGSSRALMDAFGGLPVGDLRNVTLAAAAAAEAALGLKLRNYLGSEAENLDVLLAAAVAPPPTIEPPQSKDDEEEHADEPIPEVPHGTRMFLKHRLPSNGTQEGAVAEAHRLAAALRVGANHSAALDHHIGTDGEIAPPSEGEKRTLQAKAEIGRLLEAMLARVVSSEGEDLLNLRHASVGNLVFTELVLQAVEKRKQNGRTTQRESSGVFEEAAIRFAYLSGLDPTFATVLPSVDLVWNCDALAEKSIGEVRSKLPGVSLKVSLADGTVFNSQTAFSYGDAADLTPLQLKAQGGFVRLSSQPQTLSVGGDEVVGKDNRNEWAIAFPHDRVAEHLLRADLVVFGRGSFVTSMAAAAGPVAQTLVESVVEVPNQRRVLLLNGSTDRETSAFPSATDSLVSFSEMISTAAGLAEVSLSLVTHIAFPEGSPLVTQQELQAGVLTMGTASIPIICVPSIENARGVLVYDDNSLWETLLAL